MNSLQAHSSLAKSFKAHIFDGHIFGFPPAKLCLLEGVRHHDIGTQKRNIPVTRYDVMCFANFSESSSLISCSKLKVTFFYSYIGRRFTVKVGNGVASHILSHIRSICHSYPVLQLSHFGPGQCAVARTWSSWSSSFFGFYSNIPKF